MMIIPIWQGKYSDLTTAHSEPSTEVISFSTGRTMKRKPSQIPLMNIGKDEEIFAGRVSPHIPEVGVYKILAKKKADGTIEWAHFVQRDDGSKDRVMRGTVNTRE